MSYPTLGEEPMTTKTTAPRPAEPATPLPDELRVAYQIHTLAQMLYARLAAAPHWTPMAPPPYPPIVH